jgi:hypothetical protein
LYKLYSQSWSKNAIKIVVMIGDMVPHKPEDTLKLMTKYGIANPMALDWRKSVLFLRGKGVKIYGVQCGDRILNLPDGNV